MPSVPLIQCAIIVAGALLLACSTLSKRWFYAEWVKTAFRVVFVAAIVSVALAFILSHFTFSNAVFWRIRTAKSICTGIGVGMLLLFLLSGEARRGYHRWREQRRDSHASGRETDQT
jgi:ABC-type tungstate transport system substrate-binding protein